MCIAIVKQFDALLLPQSLYNYNCQQIYSRYGTCEWFGGGGGSRDRDRDRRLGLAGSITIVIARPVDGGEEKARRSRALCECSHMGSNDRGRIVVIVTVCKQWVGVGCGGAQVGSGQWNVALFALHHPVQTARRGTRGESPILSTSSTVSLLQIIRVNIPWVSPVPKIDSREYLKTKGSLSRADPNKRTSCDVGVTVNAKGRGLRDLDSYHHRAGVL